LPGAAVELHLCAVLAGDHAEAVVLDLVQPRVAGGRDEFERQGHDLPMRAQVRGVAKQQITSLLLGLGHFGQRLLVAT
jgi:hypothetical protein